MTERTLIRGGFVLSQDPEIGEIPGGDVLIEGDKIAQVGRGLSADGAKVIDANGDVVIRASSTATGIPGRRRSGRVPRTTR